jgi:surface protein
MSHVSDANRAFFDATTFNQNIDNWDVSKVTNMSHMFLSAKAFNQNIGGWHVSKVTNMTYMFHNATSFNQNIGSWDVGKVTDMSYMLPATNVLVKGLCAKKHMTHIGHLTNIPITNVLIKGSCIKKCSACADAFNQNIGNWNVSNVTTMDSMFWAATAFNQDIGNWDISSLTNATDMFNSTSMTLNNMDGTLRGWAKLDTAANRAYTYDANGSMTKNGNKSITWTSFNKPKQFTKKNEISCFVFQSHVQSSSWLDIYIVKKIY